MIKVNDLKRYFESCNVNFLIGSGMSVPFLKTLCNVEKLLSELEASDFGGNELLVLKASIYASFFNTVISRNQEKYRRNKENDNAYEKVINNYMRFVKVVHELLKARAKTPGLTTKINLFTTNIDIMHEIALEYTHVEWNCGFSGVMNPIFSEANFSKTVHSTSRYYGRNYELPVFNLYKLHGSLNWKYGDKGEHNVIELDKDLKQVAAVEALLSAIEGGTLLVPVSGNEDFEELKNLLPTTFDDAELNKVSAFVEEYEKLPIVNPSKRKFSTTVLDMHFYELLRIYANELERSNSVLFVHGFSFADEHLTNMTLRVASSNPTLQICIFAYDKCAKIQIQNNLGMSGVNLLYSNIRVLTYDDVFEAKEDEAEVKYLDFENVNRMYESVLNSVAKNEVK